MLNTIKLLLGLTNSDKDGLLNVLIELATDEAENYTHNDNLEDLRTAIIQMVVYKYNRMGTEGLDSEGYSGVSFSYSTDYPAPIQRLLNAKRKLITL